MSVEEDTELRDLVSQTLENNGVLPKIRAELRASVFLALEEQDSLQMKTPFVNKPLKEYLSSPEGALGLCLVREFLEYLELDFTLTVFNSETHHGKGYEYSDRNKLMKDLHISDVYGKKGPLLAHVLQAALHSNKTSNLFEKKQESKQNMINSLKTSSGDSLNMNNSAELEENHVDTPNTSHAPFDQTFVTNNTSPKGSMINAHLEDAEVDEKGTQMALQLHRPQQLQQQRLPLQQQSTANQNHVSHNKSTTSNEMKSAPTAMVTKDRGPARSADTGSNPRGCDLTKKDSETSRQQDKGKRVSSTGQTSGTALTSLSNLPPLDVTNHRRKGTQVKDTESIISALMNSENQDNYEEDFQSTDSSVMAAGDGSSKSHKHSHSQRPSQRSNTASNREAPKDSSDKDVSEKGINSPIGSISEEIDDNTNSGFDDLLNSTTSGEHTVDGTLSYVTSRLADYVEDV